MTDLFKLNLGILASRFKARATLEAENLVLRQHVNVLRRRTPKRPHLNNTDVFLLHHRDDFVQGAWPAALTARVAQQARRVDACYKRFARDVFGGANAEMLRLARFVLADVPKAAVSPHLRRREPPPLIVDDMIRITYGAILNQYGNGNRTAGA